MFCCQKCPCPVPSQLVHSNRQRQPFWSLPWTQKLVARYRVFSCHCIQDSCHPNHTQGELQQQYYCSPFWTLGSGCMGLENNDRSKPYHHYSHITTWCPKQLFVSLGGDTSLASSYRYPHPLQFFIHTADWLLSRVVYLNTSGEKTNRVCKYYLPKWKGEIFGEQ